MIIYNITIQADASIANEWLHWLQHEYIPHVMGTGCFSEFRLVRLLEVDESEGPTYAIQFQADSKSDYNRYAELYAPGLRTKAFEKWGNGFIAFNSLMEVVK